MAFLTKGIRVIVVVSSRPLCPPASKPSATNASTPQSCAFNANFNRANNVYYNTTMRLQVFGP